MRALPQDPGDPIAASRSMLNARLAAALGSASPELRRRILVMASVLIAGNGLVWAGVIGFSRAFPVLLGLAALAYGFGLRHAVDPDHIAAIDNTTRKLMQDGQRPVGVGFFFSLGHSTIVVLLSAIVALSASFVHRNLPAIQKAGSMIGTSVSAGFLLLIGLINLVVLLDVVRMWRQVSKGAELDNGSLADYLDKRGLLARLFRPMLRMVTKSWQMYFVGFLFGLGFDTASEVGLLSISAVTGASGVPIWAIMLLPLCFTAGMCLIDTVDGVLMLGAYGWAQVRPVRKLYYNMNITFVSVVIAIFIGGVEALQVLGQELGGSGSFWETLNRLNLANLGFVIIGAFAASWVLSMLFYRLRRYDLLDAPARLHE